MSEAGEFKNARPGRCCQPLRVSGHAPAASYALSYVDIEQPGTTQLRCIAQPCKLQSVPASAHAAGRVYR